jgi:hypothetical protein
MGISFGNILGGGTKTSSSTNYSDSSRNLNAETGAILNSEGGLVNTGIGGDYILNYDLGADVALSGLALADNTAQGAYALAAGINATAGGAMADAFANANAMVENNARLAGQSMDTALAFASNAKPVAATFTDAIPFLAAAAAIAAIGYGLLRKKT